MKSFRELQVVEIAGSTAGAFAAKLFADYGARVIKLEPPRGDPLRTMGEPWGDLGSEWAFFNTSKRSICLDLASDSGRDELTRLLHQADVVIESASPDPLQPVSGDLGSDQLVRACISPFGLSGPYASLRSNGFTDGAIGGHMYLSGEPDREPLRRAGQQTLFQAGAHAFIGSMAALLARERIGRGQTVEVSHIEGMVALHQHTTSTWTHGGHILRREGNAQAGPYHPSGVYPCKDGYIFLGHSGDKHLVPFVDVLGYGHLFDDPRFATMGARGTHKREFDEALTVRLMELTADEISELGRAVFSPLGPVPAMLEVLEDEQFEARDFWVPLEGSTVGPGPAEPSPLKLPRGPFLIEGHAPDPRPAPAAPGGTTVEAVLANWWSQRREAPKGSQAPEALSHGPLHGVRVLDLTRVWAGPIAGRLLGDLGADVIAIESPWNRGYHAVDQHFAALTHLYPDNEVGERPWNRNAGFNKLARNKRGLTLDLKDPRCREIFAALVKRADIVLENYSPKVMPSLGFDFEGLRKLNANIVYAAMPGYGSTGPGKTRVALGPVIEAAVGLTAMMGYADSGPYRSGVAWADPVSGMAAAAGTLVALWDRNASGGTAQHMETAMAESMATFVGEELLAAQIRGSNAPRTGNRHPLYAPQGVYRCSGDDRWLAISVTTDDEWRALCAVAGLGDELASLTRDARRARHEEIDTAITAWTRVQSPDPAMQRLQTRGVIAAVVADGRDLLENPHLEARSFWAELDHPDVGPMRYPGNPIHLSETPVTYRCAAPTLGQDNAGILSELGISAEAVAVLEADGVITQVPPPLPGA